MPLRKERLSISLLLFALAVVPGAAKAESLAGQAVPASFPILLIALFLALLPLAWRKLRRPEPAAISEAPRPWLEGHGQVNPAQVLAWHIGAKSNDSRSRDVSVRSGLAEDGLRADPRLPEEMIGDIKPLSQVCGALTTWCQGQGAGWSWRFEIVPEGDPGESGDLRIEAHGRRRLPEAAAAREDNGSNSLDGSVVIDPDMTIAWVLWSWTGQPEAASEKPVTTLGPARRRLEALVLEGQAQKVA